MRLPAPKGLSKRAVVKQWLTPSRAFPYYGSKLRVISQYPRPRYRTIIEPFAGAASYSVRHPQHDVVLFDANPVVAGVWDYLIRATPSEIRSLPLVPAGKTVHDYALPEEAQWLLGFWLNQGSAAPGSKRSSWASAIGGSAYTSHWSEYSRSRLSLLVSRIKHWEVRCADYRSAPDAEATWFVDPPYKGSAGRHYVHRDVDYGHLGVWCRQLRGQVIVCEGEEHDGWLPFRPLVHARGQRKTTSTEMIWTKDS